ncbi:MAG: hypothetical protein ACRDDA_00460 [Aeromonas sp.]
MRIRDGGQPLLLALHRGGGQIGITLEPQLLGAQGLGIDPRLAQVVGQRAEAAALAAQGIGQSFCFAGSALLRLFGLFDLLACGGIGRFQLGYLAGSVGNGLLLGWGRGADKALHLLQLPLGGLQLLLVAFLLLGQVLDGGGRLAGFLLRARKRPLGAIHLLAQRPQIRGALAGITKLFDLLIGLVDLFAKAGRGRTGRFKGGGNLIFSGEGYRILFVFISHASSPQVWRAPAHSGVGQQEPATP